MRFCAVRELSASEAAISGWPAPRILIHRESQNGGSIDANHEAPDGAEDSTCGPVRTARSRSP